MVTTNSELSTCNDGPPSGGGGGGGGGGGRGEKKKRHVHSELELNGLMCK